EAFLKTMSKSQKVAQRKVAARLVELGAGTADVADVVATSTGAALDDLVDAAEAADVVPTTLSVSDVARVETNNGTVVYEFTVTPDRASTQAVSVRFDTGDFTATVADGDYDAASGLLTWAPGDASPRTVQVVARGDTRFEGDEAFLVFFSEVEHALMPH